MKDRKVRSCEFGRREDELTLLLDDQLVHFRGDQVTEVEVETTFRYPLVRALPNGDFVLLEAPHGLILKPNGQPRHRFPAGEAIEHVQVDATGMIWLAYYDEGISRPVSENGLNCFASDGELERGFHELGILNCYALNVDEDAVWLCYHSGFPIVRVGYDGKVEAWTNEVRGAKALVARGCQVALYGNYDWPDRLSLVDLHELGTSSVRATHTVVLPDGEPPGWVQSQSQTLHTLHEGVWHRLGWDDIPG